MAVTERDVIASLSSWRIQHCLRIATETRVARDLLGPLANQVLEHLAANIGQLSVAARMQVTEPFVIEAHQVQ